MYSEKIRRLVCKLTAVLLVATLFFSIVAYSQTNRTTKQQPHEQTSSPGVPGKLTFSSDSTGNYDIFSENADGTGRTQLTVNAADDIDPTWSPDGKQIAFLSNRDGNFEIYVMKADGSNQTRITNTVSDEFDPAWSPNGAKIAFSSDRDGDFEIYTINVNGTGEINLTNDSADDAFPTWSPDSTQIAFDSNRNGDAQIFVMNADGSGVIALTSGNGNNEFPAWSPNGRLLAFSSDRFGNFDIFTMNVDGSNQRRITSSNKEETFAAWSPDSARLSYMSGDLVGAVIDHNDVIISAPNGAILRNITNSAADEIYPDWQPLVSAVQANPIDDQTLFVRQQYLDFLMREPDAQGLVFWVSQITSCGNDATCTSARRVNVSAAFFLSIEFQQTGYLVYRSYKASYGNLPFAPVPIRFNEFLDDTQQISQGLIVGQTGWEQVLENNKRAFFADFVTRSRFTTAYPTSLTPAQFVDALFSTAGVSPTTAARTAAINEFGSATNTADTAARARALRDVAENSTLAQQEINKAFVLMEYFGYLRRNPNDSPDNNYDGYSFWLAKLNQFNGDFVSAEMVKAFITSAEYRRRFAVTP